MSSVLLLVLPDTSCNGSRHWGRCTGLFHHIWISWVWWWWLWIWQWPWRSWILGFLTWPHVFWYTGPIFACPFPRSTLWLSIGQHDMTQMILLYIISLYILYIIHYIIYNNMTPKWKFCFKIHIVVIFPSLPPYFSALSSILPSQP